MNQDEFQKIKHLGLFRQMLKMGIPLMIAQAVNILYNVVDRLYITRMTSEAIPNLGEVAFTGLSVCFPIILIISAFAGLIGGGGAPIAAIKLGEDNVDYAHKVLKNCFVMALIFCAIVTAVFFIFKEPLLHAFGAGEKTYEYADQYLTVYLFGTIFVFITMSLNPFITTQGKTKMAMITIIMGAVINIGLDPLFIFTFNMGVRGAALATVISQAGSAAFVFFYLINKNRYLRLNLKHLKPDFAIVKKIIALGFSPFTFQATEALVQIALFSSIKNHSGSLYVEYQAAMGFIITISQLVIFPVIGFDQGTQALMGYNFGAKNYENVRKIMKRNIIFLTVIFSTMLIVIMFFSKELATLFTNQPKTISITAEKLRIYWGAMFLLGFLFTIQISFLAMGQAKTSFFIAILRKVIVLVPLVFILPIFLGIDGIFYAAPIADLISVSTAIILMSIKKKKLLPKKQEVVYE